MHPISAEEYATPQAFLLGTLQVVVCNTHPLTARLQSKWAETAFLPIQVNAVVHNTMHVIKQWLYTSLIPVLGQLILATSGHPAQIHWQITVTKSSNWRQQSHNEKRSSGHIIFKKWRNVRQRHLILTFHRLARGLVPFQSVALSTLAPVPALVVLAKLTAWVLRLALVYVWREEKRQMHALCQGTQTCRL